MFGFDLYILFLFIIIALSGIIVAYYAYDNFEIAIITFVISSIVAAAFYDNAPVWISEEVESGIGSYLRGGLLLFSGLIGFIHFLKRARIHKFQIPIHMIALVIFVLLSLASTLYSIDTKSTFTRSSLLLLVLMFLLGLNSWLDSNEKFLRLLNTLFYVAAIILLLNLCAMFTIPSRTWWWKTPSRFLGLFSHPNGLGGFCSIAFPIILWKIQNTISSKKYLTIGILFINLFILISTGSRTSMIMVLIMTVFWVFYYKDWIKLSILAIMIIVGSILFSQIKISSLTRAEGSKLTSLTEREFIWQGAAAFIKEKPVWGYGYSVEGKIFADQLLFDMEEQFFNANAQQPLHNGYLSIFIGGGLIGLILWLTSIGFSLFNLIKSKKSIIKIYALVTLVAILIANIVENAITGYLSSTDIFFWIAWVVGGKVWLYNEQSETEIEQNKLNIKVSNYATS